MAHHRMCSSVQLGIVSTVDCASYLGVSITSDRCWNTHINQMLSMPPPGGTLIQRNHLSNRNDPLKGCTGGLKELLPI